MLMLCSMLLRYPNSKANYNVPQRTRPRTEFAFRLGYLGAWPSRDRPS